MNCGQLWMSSSRSLWRRRYLAPRSVTEQSRRRTLVRRVWRNTATSASPRSRSSSHAAWNSCSPTSCGRHSALRSTASGRWARVTWSRLAAQNLAASSSSESGLLSHIVAELISPALNSSRECHTRALFLCIIMLTPAFFSCPPHPFPHPACILHL